MLDDCQPDPVEAPPVTTTREILGREQEILARVHSLFHRPERQAPHERPLGNQDKKGDRQDDDDPTPRAVPGSGALVCHKR